MRQVFSSPRMENIDRVEALLHEVGIETYVSHRDKLQRHRLHRFSYRNSGSDSSWPAIWIKHAEDLPRARQLLREAGLMGSTRPDIATQYQLSPSIPEEKTPYTVTWTRQILLALIVVLALYTFWSIRASRQESAIVAPAATHPLLPSEPDPSAPHKPVESYDMVIVIDEVDTSTE